MRLSRLALAVAYFLCAIVLNSVPLAIMQGATPFKISPSLAGLLPAVPEVSILILALLIGSAIAKIGYRRGLLISAAVTFVMCLAMSFLHASSAAVAFLFITGASFVFVKIAVYSLVGVVTHDNESHLSYLCFLEAVFMAGNFVGNALFFNLCRIGSTTGNGLSAFHVTAAIALVAFSLLLLCRFDESPAPRTSLSTDLLPTVKLMISPLVVAFVASSLLYVLSEQSALHWFLAYNRSVIHTPTSVTVQQMITLLIVAACIGRLAASFLVRYFHWFTLVLICLCAESCLVLLIVPLGSASSSTYQLGALSAPLAAFLFPFITLFLAPIYPAMNSVALTATPKADHGRMAGLIMFFSAIGGITGRTITSKIFFRYGGESALYLSLISIGGLVISLFYIDHLRSGEPNEPS